MTEAIRSWILGIAGAALITSICMTITPDGRVKKIVSLVCGLVIILMLVNPMIGFDYGIFSESYARFRAEAAAFSEAGTDFSENLTGLIIAEASTAYILDKGTKLGMHDLLAEVSARQGGAGYWYPYAARLTTAANQETRDKLGDIIYADLGIPPEELIWRMNYER